MKTKSNLLMLSISLLSFLRCASGFGIGMALPLYYYGKIEAGLIGFVVAATALAYLFSPYLFRNVYKKIGMKMCLLISSIGFVSVQIGLQFFLEFPIIVYILLFCDGIILGLFWPVIAGLFSVILTQEGIRNDELKKKKLNRNFGLSWNIGGLFGYLLSAFALFIMSDILIVFDMSLIYTIIGLVIAISFKQPISNFGNINVLEVKDVDTNLGTNWKYPIVVPLLMAALFGFILGAFGVLYPVKSKILSFSDFSVYLVSFIRMLFQTACVSWALVLPMRVLKKVIPFLMVIGILGLFIISFTVDLIICIVIVGTLGIFIGFSHSFGFRLTINKNVERNDMRATTYFETIMGFNFLIGPIIGGFLAGISAPLGFWTLAIVILIAMIFFISLQNKIEID